MSRIAQAGRHGMAYVREKQPGVTPDNPAMRCLRGTGSSLNLKRDSFVSNEIRPDRQISGVRTGTSQVSGDLSFELSYGAFDDFLEAALCGNWQADELQCGLEEISFTIERSFGDIGEYILYKGCFVNGMSLSLQPNAMGTGSFSIVGMDAATSREPLAAAIDSGDGNAVFDTYTGELLENGLPIAVVTGIDLTLDNGIQPQFVLFRRDAPFVSFGKSNITGTMTAFFENMGLISKFLDESPTSLEFTLEGDGGSYTFILPNIRYTGAELPVDGDGPISISMPFQAILDECSGTNMIIRRNPASIAIAPCALAWEGSAMHQLTTGDFEPLAITLAGGRNKVFAGSDNLEIPGVTFSGLPAGITARVVRASPTSARLELAGSASGEADILVRFSARSFNRGFCDCPGESVANAESAIHATFASMPSVGEGEVTPDWD